MQCASRRVAPLRLTKQRQKRLLHHVVSVLAAAHVRGIAKHRALVPREQLREGVVIAPAGALDELAVVHVTRVVGERRQKVPGRCGRPHGLRPVGYGPSQRR